MLTPTPSHMLDLSNNYMMKKHEPQIFIYWLVMLKQQDDLQMLLESNTAKCLSNYCWQYYNATIHGVIYYSSKICVEHNEGESYKTHNYESRQLKQSMYAELRDWFQEIVILKQNNKQ